MKAIVITKERFQADTWCIIYEDKEYFSGFFSLVTSDYLNSSREKNQTSLSLFLVHYFTEFLSENRVHSEKQYVIKASPWFLKTALSQVYMSSRVMK